MSGSYPYVGWNPRARMWTWWVQNSLGLIVQRSPYHYDTCEAAVRSANRAGWRPV